MALLYRKSQLIAKIEGTPGSAETVAATDGVFDAEDIVFQPSIAFTGRSGQASFSPIAGTLGAKMGTISFRLQLYGGATDPVWASTFLPACGYVVDTGVYTPRSEAPGTNVKTVTIFVYRDGMRFGLRGAVGTFTLTIEPGRTVYADFTFTGIYVTPTDAALLAANYPRTAPLRAVDASFSLGSLPLNFSQFTLDAGNTVAMIEDVTDASGFAHAIITGRTVTGSVNGLQQKIASDDVWTPWEAHTESALDVTFGTTGNQIDIDAPAVQITNVQETDRNGLLAHDVTLQFNRSADAGDDELEFNFL